MYFSDRLFNNMVEICSLRKTEVVIAVPPEKDLV